jgi:VCBS repeat-containing protein
MLSRVLGLSGFGFVFALLAACGGGSKNHDPVLTAASLTGTEDTVLTGQLSATDEDGDPVTFARATAATHGTVTVSASGAVSYTPNANYAGTDSFTVTVSDDDGGTSTGTVSITLAGVNDAPDFTSPASSRADAHAPGFDDRIRAVRMGAMIQGVGSIRRPISPALSDALTRGARSAPIDPCA